MPYGPANEIIDHARACHQRVSEFYEQLTEKATAARVKMLLDYLARHEKNLARILTDYEQDVRARALREWQHYSDENMHFKNMDPNDFSADMTIDDVMKIVATIDNCFIDSYQGMVDTATNKDVVEIFENLLHMEKQEKLTISRVLLELNDM